MYVEYLSTEKITIVKKKENTYTRKSAKRRVKMDLKEYKEKYNHTLDTLSSRLKCHRGYICQIMTGKRSPGANMRRKIERLLKQAT